MKLLQKFSTGKLNSFKYALLKKVEHKNLMRPEKGGQGIISLKYCHEASENMTKYFSIKLEFMRQSIQKARGKCRDTID